MDYSSLKFIAASITVLGMFGAAMGVSNIFCKLFDAIGRNPEADEKLKKYVYSGAALVEAMGLFSFVLALLFIFAT